MSLRCYSYYTKRDLLYKTNRFNIYNLINCGNFHVYQKTSNRIYSSLSSFIILFDKMSYLSQLKKSPDKKLIKSFVHTILTLNITDFINFLLSLKINNFNLSESGIKKNVYHFKINSNLFNEFIFYYQKFVGFFDMNFVFSFINCNNRKEKQLLISNLNNII